MIDQDSLPTGSLDDVEQEEHEPFAHPPIPTLVTNVVAVHQTGSKHGVSFNRKVNSVDGAVRLLAENRRRRIVRLLCDQQFYVSVQQPGLVTGSAAFWNANTVLEITHTEEIWVYLPIDGTMNVISEDWAD
jgi:hypothetical protein